MLHEACTCDLYHNTCIFLSEQSSLQDHIAKFRWIGGAFEFLLRDDANLCMINVVVCGMRCSNGGLVDDTAWFNI